jgi:hypothetical protein
MQLFSDLTSIAAAVIGGTNSPEYKAAQAAFGQSPRVSQVAIGNLKSNKVITDNAGTYTAGSILVTVNGHVITQTYSTDKDGTLTALAAQIAALAEIDTCAYSSGSHTITIAPNAGYLVTVSAITLTGITGTMTMATTSTEAEDWDDALTAIKIYNSTSWYGIVAVTRDEGDVADIAAWAEANEKLYITASADTEVVSTTLSGDTGSIAKVLNALGYARTSLIYHPDAATTYPDAGFMGRILPLEPGSYTAMFKNLAGISVVSMTTDQENNAREKFVNIYEEIGGKSITRDGVVVGEEYIDVIISIDWLDARMTEDVYQLLTSQLKVPFTDAGISAVDSVVKKRLQIAQNRGMISPTAYDENNVQIGGFVTSVPKLADISSVDRAARHLNGVTFTAWLAGAIHAVVINGVVTI